jgi:hypothetical protein
MRNGSVTETEPDMAKIMAPDGPGRLHSLLEALHENKRFLLRNSNTSCFRKRRGDHSAMMRRVIPAV